MARVVHLRCGIASMHLSSVRTSNHLALHARGGHNSDMPMPTDPVVAAKCKKNLRPDAKKNTDEFGQKLLKMAEKMKPKTRMKIDMSKTQATKFAIWYIEQQGGTGIATEYKPEYCVDIINYFREKCDKPFQEVKQIAKDKWGNVLVNKKTGEPTYYTTLVPNTPPYLVEYAAKVGVWVDTLADWAVKHPDFDRAMQHAKELRTTMLVNNGLVGLYNPQSWIFAAKNLSGMSDRTDITSKDQQVFNVSVTPFQKPADDASA